MFTFEKVRLFVGLLVRHLRVHWAFYVVVPITFSLFAANYRICVNETVSLPQTLFLLHRNSPVGLGDYVAFRARPSNGAVSFDPKMILVKRVVGVAGDIVEVRDRVVLLNGQPVGFAKERSLKNEPLDPIRSVTIPKGMFYVIGLHRDSLDSRYSIVGLVDSTMLVGRAIPLI
jgi:conjugative transfer signal peptidase TraF